MVMVIEVEVLLVACCCSLACSCARLFAAAAVFGSIPPCLTLLEATDKHSMMISPSSAVPLVPGLRSSVARTPYQKRRRTVIRL